MEEKGERLKGRYGCRRHDFVEVDESVFMVYGLKWLDVMKRYLNGIGRADTDRILFEITDRFYIVL